MGTLLSILYICRLYSTLLHRGALVQCTVPSVTSQQAVQGTNYSTYKCSLVDRGSSTVGLIQVPSIAAVHVLAVLELKPVFIRLASVKIMDHVATLCQGEKAQENRQ